MRSDQAILFCKVKPSSICVHGTGNRGNRGRIKNEKSLANLKNVRYNGYMSPATKRKCSSMLEAWIYTLGYNENRNNYKINPTNSTLQFVTLTLPAEQLHTDQEIRSKLLAPFIQDLKRYHQTEHYFWKAEKATNHRIHFHILISTRIAHQQIRALWNKQLRHLGYIERYRSERQAFHRSGFTVDRSRLKNWPIASQVRAFNFGRSSNWSSPNSTDIHSLRSVRSAHAYIVKYCMKSTDINKVEGRIWGCSDSIRDLVFTSKPLGLIEQLDLNRLLDKTKAQQVTGDHFSVTFNFTTTQLQLHAPALFFRLFSDLSRFAHILNHGTQPSIDQQKKIPKPKPPDLQQQFSFHSDTRHAA